MDRKVNNKDWTRNIHQKFDVVCQEVDEFVGMGTIKYVENQVQTIGETFKGFCSNVMQDFLPALSDPANHDAGTVPQKGKFVTETYKKSVTNLNEKYADTDTKSLPSASSNPVKYDEESIPRKGKQETRNYNKPLIRIKEKYANIASKRVPTKQDSVHHVPPYYRLNNVKQTMPMPTEGDKKITKALLPLARDESVLVHDNVKTSGVGYIGSEFEGLNIEEKSLSEDSNFIGSNDETSLVFVTEDDYHNHEIADDVTEDDNHNCEITDEAVSAALDDSVRVWSSVKERTCDTFFDDYHCKILGTPQPSDVECSFSSGCQVVEPTLFSSTSSLFNDSYYRSEFSTSPHKTENFVCDLTDSVSSCSETSGHADKSKINIPYPNMKTIDLTQKTKLNESCVIVDNEFLGATSFRPRRHRSYKQMIKDAYTKTKRLTKEHELLGILYGDIDKEPVQQEKHSSRLPSISERTPGNEHSLTKDDLGDGDWELL